MTYLVDHLLVDAVTELFTMISTSSSPLVGQVLSQRVLLRLGQVLVFTELPSTNHPLVFTEAPSTKDLTVVKASSVAVIDAIFTGKAIPLSPGMFEAVAQGVFVALASTDDSDLIQVCGYNLSPSTTVSVYILTWPQSHLLSSSF